MGLTKRIHRKIKYALGMKYFINCKIKLNVNVEQERLISFSSSILKTTLCNTALDNPNKVTKQDVVNYMLNYLPTDTILYHSSVS